MDGTGTIDNPYDAATSTKLQALLGTVSSATGTLYTTYGTTSTFKVHWFPGTYHTTTGVPIFTNWEYDAPGGGAVLEYDGNATTVGVISNYSFGPSWNNIRVSDLTVDCNAGATSSWNCAGVFLRGASNLVVENVTVRNHNGPTPNEVNAIGVTHLASGNCYGIQLKNNRVETPHGTTSVGIGISGNGANLCYASEISGNTITGPINIAYGINSQSGGRIIGNYCDNATYGIIADTGNSTELTIAENRFYTTGYGALFGGSDIYDSYSVRDNYFKSASGEGIRLNGNVTNSLFEHNVITGATPTAFNSTGNTNNAFIDNILDSGVTDAAATNAAVTYYKTPSGAVKAESYATSIGMLEVPLSSTTITLGADGNTTLYAVPAGKRCVLTKALFIAEADAGTSTLTIGQAGALTDFLGTQTLSAVDAKYDVAILQPVPNATPVIVKSYAAGVVVKAVVGSHAGAAGNTLVLFGYLY